MIESNKVVISFHKKFKQYDFGEGHPFRGDRFVKAMKFFESQNLFGLSKIVRIEPESATKEDLLRVHDESYVNLICRLAKENGSYDIETPVSLKILEALLLIVGGAMNCGQAIFERKAKRAISIGGGHHHAGRHYGGGFCLFNDVAILVEFLKFKYGVKRFLILDYDAHFGNGTSDIYYRDPEVLYISLHQDPRTIYPGKGFVWQIGEGKGEGYNVNVPLPPGTSDSTYLYALNQVFIPLAEGYEPEIIICNGGSDPHFADMLGGLSLTVEGFFKISDLIRETADRVCGGRLILIPGSGYNLEILPLCWYALIAGAIGLSEITFKEQCVPPQEPVQCRSTTEKTIDELKRLLRKYWLGFGGF